MPRSTVTRRNVAAAPASILTSSLSCVAAAFTCRPHDRPQHQSCRPVRPRNGIVSISSGRGQRVATSEFPSLLELAQSPGLLGGAADCHSWHVRSERRAWRGSRNDFGPGPAQFDERGGEGTVEPIARLTIYHLQVSDELCEAEDRITAQVNRVHGERPALEPSVTRLRPEPTPTPRRRECVTRGLLNREYAERSGASTRASTSAHIARHRVVEPDKGSRPLATFRPSRDLLRLVNLARGRSEMPLQARARRRGFAAKEQPARRRIRRTTLRRNGGHPASTLGATVCCPPARPTQGRQ